MMLVDKRNLETEERPIPPGVTCGADGGPPIVLSALRVIGEPNPGC